MPDYGYEYGVPVGRAVTQQFGGKWTPQKRRFFEAWARAEGTKAAYNPFATTRRGYSGETNFNSVGVKNYKDLETGIKATFDTLSLNYYTELVDLLRQPNVTAKQLAEAVAASPWGTGAGVLRVLGITSSEGYERAQSTAQYGAKKGQLEQQYQTITTERFRPSEAYMQALERMGPAGAPALRLARNWEPLSVDVAVEAAANSTGGTTVPSEGMVRTNDAQMNKVLQIAHAQIGKPYIWGGESPAEGGFDCSGLIEWSFEQAGIKTPGRITTYTAAKLGRSVMDEQWKPGDWLITNGGKHMVMYVGGGQVIAAPHRGAVVRYQPVSDFEGDIVDVRRYGRRAGKLKPSGKGKK